MRTVKSCGSGVAVLASRSGEAKLLWDNGGKRAVLREEHEVSRKAIAQGVNWPEKPRQINGERLICSHLCRDSRRFSYGRNIDAYTSPVESFGLGRRRVASVMSTTLLKHRGDLKMLRAKLQNF